MAHGHQCRVKERGAMISKDDPRLSRPMTAEQYAEEWVVEASNFAKHGDYTWMASFLPKKGAVLEVGCGSGASTLAIIRSGNSVVSVEQNDFLATTAYEYLLNQGFSVKRHSLQDLKPEDLMGEEQAHIVLGDIFSVDICSRLPASYFSAMTCWLIGSSPDVVNSTLADQTGESENWDPAAYRWLVHQRCCDVSRDLLKEKSSVHLIDRGMINTWATKDEYRKGWAEGYNEKLKLNHLLTEKNVMFRKFSVELGTSQIQYSNAVPNAPKGLGVFSAINIVIS